MVATYPARGSVMQHQWFLETFISASSSSWKYTTSKVDGSTNTSIRFLSCRRWAAAVLWPNSNQFLHFFLLFVESLHAELTGPVALWRFFDGRSQAVEVVSEREKKKGNWIWYYLYYRIVHHQLITNCQTKVSWFWSKIQEKCPGPVRHYLTLSTSSSWFHFPNPSLWIPLQQQLQQQQHSEWTVDNLRRSQRFLENFHHIMQYACD